MQVHISVLQSTGELLTLQVLTVLQKCMCQLTAWSYSTSGWDMQAELAKMPAVGQAMPPELQAERQTNDREARQLDMQVQHPA